MTNSPFTIDMQEITASNRVILGDWAAEDFKNLSEGLSRLAEESGITPVQRGRVIAIRQTDDARLFSAFKSALYLGKYNSMQDTRRFLSKMVKSHHSYEPIRGENILFLFVGVGKPVYDHMATYTVGRPTRIAGGQRANLPWGIEIPVEMKDREGYIARNMERVKAVINLTGKGEEKPEVREQLQAVRSELPVGYVMPPFLLEFSEEMLVKTVFRQRLWEKGAQGATVDIVNDMWQCCLALDKEKFETLLDYHGPHTVAWEKAMRTLRDEQLHLDQLLAKAGIDYTITEEHGLSLQTDISVYDLIMKTVGKLPPTMWDKMK